MNGRFKDVSLRLQESIRAGSVLSKEVMKRGGERLVTSGKVTAEVAINAGVYMGGGAVTGYLIPYVIYPYYFIGAVGESIVRQAPPVLPLLSEVHEAGLITAAAVSVYLAILSKSQFPNDSFRFS